MYVRTLVTITLQFDDPSNASKYLTGIIDQYEEDTKNLRTEEVEIQGIVARTDAHGCCLQD